jgi:cell division protein FtsI/penicillin-binding protein 2
MIDLNNNYLLIYLARFKNTRSFLKLPFVKSGFAAVLLLAVIVCTALLSNSFDLSIKDILPAKKIAKNKLSAKAGESSVFDQKEISSLFEKDFFYRDAPPAIFSSRDKDNSSMTVFTTLEPAIQKQMMRLFKRYRPVLAAGVIIDAKSGAVLAMGNYTKKSETADLFPERDGDYCLYAGFPAASLIKIVTAAAAIEKKGFTSAMTLPVSGRYHTLYKHQLGLKRLRFRPENISLEKAFSKSINPFFGKLGIQYLSNEDFDEIAELFLFNIPLEFDFPVSKSTTFIPENNFEKAELASGFNTRTTISPLHAALIASLPVSDGKIMRPYVIDRVVSEDGKDLYSSSIEDLSQPINSQSLKYLSRLMRATTRYGTAGKSFYALRHSRIYRGLSIGGKTGAINLPNKQRRCEWFAGFAEKEDMHLAISLVFIHGDKRTVNPSLMAAELIKTCLKEQPLKTAGKKSRGKISSPG